MQEQLSYVAAMQSKTQIQANIEALLNEQNALLANADKQIKLEHQQLSQAIADQIATRIGVDNGFVSRLIQNVFGMEQVLVNLEPIKFQPYFHLKEMKKLREVLKVMADNGLIEIDHIFTNEEEKRFLINSFLPEVSRNLLSGRHVNPLTNELMDKHIFYRHYFQIVHTTDKYLTWVEEAKAIQALEEKEAGIADQFQAVA